MLNILFLQMSDNNTAFGRWPDDEHTSFHLLRWPNDEDIPEYWTAWNKCAQLQKDCDDNDTQIRLTDMEIQALTERLKALKQKRLQLVASVEQEVQYAKFMANESEQQASFFAGVVRMAVPEVTETYATVAARANSKSKVVQKSTSS